MSSTNYRERMDRLIDELETFRTAADGAMELHEQFQELNNEMWDHWDEVTGEAEEAIEKLADLESIADVCSEMHMASTEYFNGGRHYSFPDLQLNQYQMDQVRKLAEEA